MGGLADKGSAAVGLALLAPWARTNKNPRKMRGGVGRRAGVRTHTFHLIWMGCLFNRPPLFHQRHSVGFFLPFLKSRFDSRLREELPAVYPHMITIIRGGTCLRRRLFGAVMNVKNLPFTFV